MVFFCVSLCFSSIFVFFLNFIFSFWFYLFLLVNKLCLVCYVDNELVYRDPTGGLSIISAVNFSTRILMSNSTFVSFFFSNLNIFDLRHVNSTIKTHNKFICLFTLFYVCSQRQLNAEKYLVSPDTQFVVLLADVDEHGAR